MKTWFKYLRTILNVVVFIGLSFIAFNHRTFIYLFYQGIGQWNVLSNTQAIYEYEKNKFVSATQKNNLLLVQQIKKFSVDSLNFEPTENFNRIYDQQGKPLLWLITASEPFGFEPYYWQFPIVGRVSYKGFFRKEMALKEYIYLVAKGYDVEMRQVSAWSTLGWFNDPILSNMLERNKGAVCNLIFHELFHATYYASDAVNDNENLAEFVAQKATLRFLRNDSLAFRNYLQDSHDADVYTNYLRQKLSYLTNYYQQIKGFPDRNRLKNIAISIIADSIANLPFYNKERYTSRRKDLLKFKNAYFIGFIQYNSLQDSLEGVFNKIYKGKIEKLVQDLKLN